MHLLKSLRLDGFLSFAPGSAPIELTCILMPCRCWPTCW